MTTYVSSTVLLGPDAEFRTFTFDERGPIFFVGQQGASFQFSPDTEATAEVRERFAEELVTAAAQYAIAVREDNARRVAS